MTRPDEPQFKEEFAMSEDNRIRVLVVDDHPLVRDSLRRVLENTGEFEIVGQASDGGERSRWRRSCARTPSSWT